MAPNSRRVFGWLPVVALLAVWPLAWFAASARGEPRKFVVILADPSKDHMGSTLTLPNRMSVWDSYFDKVKNGQNGSPRVDSFAEWWEEVSYGDVTVNGDVYGWFSLPWPTRPPGFDGNTGFGSTSVIPHISLTGSLTMQPGEGEGAGFMPKYKFYFDGNPPPGHDPFDYWRMPQFDAYGNFAWSPGERFQDLNGDGFYDAGIAEFGYQPGADPNSPFIGAYPYPLYFDKNGDGVIDLSKKASSWADLLSGAIMDVTDPQNPVWTGRWDVGVNDREWFDSNGDGLLGWSGTEIWIDRNGDGKVGQAVQSKVQGQPATLGDFIAALYNPQDQSEYWDWNNNTRFDFPEPFEDFLVRWGGGGWVPVTPEYVRANFPGNTEELIARAGNRLYDPPDGWGNRSNINNTNKLQEMDYYLLDSEEFAEQARRGSYVTGQTDPNSGFGVPTWLGTFWQEYFGTQAPQWRFDIPYLHKFNPGQPMPIPRDDPTNPGTIPFNPNSGGPYNNGRPERDTTFSGIIHPDPADPLEGMYDGPAEFVDLSSSIYHSGGDGDMGEVTSVNNSPSNPRSKARWGEDCGANTPNSPAPDGRVEAAGPLAYNVHGDGGYDGGNQINIEYLTWRTDGTSNTDTAIDFDGDGIPDYVVYHRDTNLDGMIDLGETPGDAGDFAQAFSQRVDYSNYGVDTSPGTPPNGGPQGDYPFNRHRLLEDCVAALDESVDWTQFLNGPPPFGNVISGVVLCPATTAVGMFALPASSFDQVIQTRDPVYRTPITYWDGLGIGLNDDAGEGGTYAVGSFHTAFAAHEYCHMWEGYPDLYDYDTYRPDFPGVILNNPVGAWDVMSGGGLVHPAPVLKTASGWIHPVDITTALAPAGSTTLELRAWEFDRNKTTFYYTNPLDLPTDPNAPLPGPLARAETFWFWRNSPGVVSGNTLVRQAFDLFQPGWGVVIMHVDLRAGTEEQALPQQQRLEGHFIYQVVQADGLFQLDAGTNMGDAGDPWPGSSGAVLWNRDTSPPAKWYNGQSCGLDITNIQQLANSSLVTFHWSPRELPTFEWIQPPGGISVNGIYNLRYLAFDQYGGTTIEFYASRSVPDTPPSYDFQFSLGQTTKAPGEIDGVYPAQVHTLADGVYTFYARLVPGVGVDGNHERGWSIPRASLNNTGTGKLTIDGADLAISRLQSWVVSCIDDSIPNQEQWMAVGSASGAQQGLATTGMPYMTDADPQGRHALSFTITPGDLPFRVGDQFLFLTTGLTPFSSAVLVDNGEVIAPQPPTAVARIADGTASGLAPLSVTFKHDLSTDPHGATLTFNWDFGDGSNGFSTSTLDMPVPHTYTRAGRFTVTLTATNAFDLQDQDQIQITVTDALPPTVRVAVSPLSGVRPLRVQFSGDLTTDPNPQTQGMDFVWDFGDGSPPATTSRAVHVYTEPGIYQAVLTVTNRPYGKSAAKLVEIHVTGTGSGNQPPVAVLGADRMFGAPPLTVAFDASASYDPEGGALTYQWNFDDGSVIALGQTTVQHTFTFGGTYQVTLTVTDVTSQSDSATLAIAVIGSQGGAGAPVARIVASGTQGPAPFTVTFDASSSNDPAGGALSYLWDFNDGSAAQTDAVVGHTFTVPREYNVVLQAVNAAGLAGEATVQIAVTSPSEQQSQLPAPSTNTTVPTISPGCGTGCGPAGLMPILLTLAGLGGLKRYHGQRRR